MKHYYEIIYFYMKNIPLNFIKKYISEKENRKFYFTKKKKKKN